MYTPATVSTLTDTRLIASTLNIVQPYLTSSCSVFPSQHLAIVSVIK